jgi:hypothetical protein
VQRGSPHDEVTVTSRHADPSQPMPARASATRCSVGANEEDLMRKAIILAFVLAACGGGGGGDFPPESGVDPAMMVSGLSPADQNTLCAWSIDATGGTGHVAHCPDDIDVTVAAVADCVADIDAWTCGATVADYEACINATGGDPCKLLSEEACSLFFECSF